ncbi:MAG: glycoside hydrolase family 97 catalytic domain-containing protein [Bacteroidaceae bacterium]|nr:glycoside hydrolase family 97 catalytic domain-containing protein [Bacteroidaceae bacterium]
MKANRWVLMVCMACLCHVLWAGQRSWSVLSPDKQLKADVFIEKEQVYFTLSHGQTQVLLPSRAAMRIQRGTVLGENVSRSVKTKQGSARVTRDTPFYRKSQVDEAYTWFLLQDRKWGIEFRVFNGGMAYRFVTQFKDDSLYVEDERNEFCFAADFEMCYLPLRGMDTDFQGLYKQAKLSSISADEMIAPQCLVRLDDGKCALVTDFNVRDYPTMFMQSVGGNILHGYYPKYPKKEEAFGKNMTRSRVLERQDYLAHSIGKRTYPWRVVLVTGSEAELLDSDVLCCLADPCELKDVSWIRPGKASWEWWNACNLTGVDFKTGVNNETYKYFIDFASQHGIEYILMDEGWTLRQQPMDLLRTIPEIDLPMLVNYGKEKGVGIILWSDYLPFDADMERVVREYAQMGVKGFKIDHMNRNDQKVVKFAERAAKLCARYHMIVDFHGVFPPTGLQFTYPNVLNYEAVLGLEAVKGKKELDLVTHECIVPFTRQVVGPIDYTQGAMRNATKDGYFGNRIQPMSQGTRCRQLAEYVVFESPFNMLCDSPTQYEANPQCLDFIAEVPVVWDETKVLRAELGKFIIVARRKGTVWYVGGITDWDEREIDLDVSFMKGREVKVYRDGVNADKNAEDFRVENIPFSGKLQVHLASGGGFAAVVM